MRFNVKKKMLLNINGGSLLNRHCLLSGRKKTEESDTPKQYRDTAMTLEWRDDELQGWVLVGKMKFLSQ